MATIGATVVIIIDFRLHKQPIAQERLAITDKRPITVQADLFVFDIATAIYTVIQPFTRCEVMLPV